MTTVISCENIPVTNVLYLLYCPVTNGLSCDHCPNIYYDHSPVQFSLPYIQDPVMTVLSCVYCPVSTALYSLYRFVIIVLYCEHDPVPWPLSSPVTTVLSCPHLLSPNLVNAESAHNVLQDHKWKHQIRTFTWHLLMWKTARFLLLLKLQHETNHLYDWITKTPFNIVFNK